MDHNPETEPSKQDEEENDGIDAQVPIIFGEEIRAAFADALDMDPEKITAKSRWKTHLDCDSLDEVNVLCELEIVLDISISDAEFQQALRESGGDPSIEEVMEIVKRIAKK